MFSHIFKAFGFGGGKSETLLERREKLYRKWFGKTVSASHGLLPQEPHIDVYRYGPEGRRDWFTYVTSGISDQPIIVPDFPHPVRCELVFYSAREDEMYARFLHFLARKPFEDPDCWISHGTTFGGGASAQPLFPGTPFTAVGFAVTPLPPECKLPNRLQVEGVPVFLLWVIPLYPKEHEFIVEYDIDQFINLVGGSDFEFVFSESRPEQRVYELLRKQS